ncbi:MAG: chromate transporter [Bacteroidales bacterium]|nr:chromate transporter [Bacteroidales bacterium]
MAKVSLWDLFVTFFKVGAFTIGGGYMMLPAIQDAIQRKGWIPDEDLPDIVALSQSAPGLISVNMSIFTGYRLRGLAGSVVATVACVLPPFVTILLIAMFFTSFRSNAVVERIFLGVRPVTVALIASYTLKLLKAGGLVWWKLLLSAGTLAAVALLKFSPVYILLTVIVTAVAAGLWRQKKGRGA